ncbi:MAG: helix-turn-helix transcriptional regulator, partial [Succinivibrio sp.]|nr:helix-turn-helix transcriptional regulator [Succinivibrio sp.]
YALTEKEADILKEIVQIKSIRAMALDLDITERTVKYRISRIFEKTGNKNQRELISIISE